ncbi:unnamed protein product, partial [Ixodes persulcatus]
PLVPCEAWDYDLLPERHTIISFWNLVCNRSRLLFIASAFENVGGLLLVPVVGQTTDRVGRRPATFFCVIVALISGFLASVAKKFPIFVVARVFVAASVNALKLVIFILLLEVTSSDRRELYGCLVHIGSVAAFIFVVSIHGFFMDRQVVSLITMMPMSFLVFAFYAVQESPRWLLALQDVESARAVLLVVSHLNNVNTRKFQNPPWNAACVPTKRTTFTFVHLISIHALRKRTLTVCWAWLCVSTSLFSIVLTYSSFRNESRGPEINDVSIISSFGAILGAYGLLRLCDRKTTLFLLLPLSSMLTIAVAVGFPIFAKLHVEFMLTIISSALQATNVVLYIFTFEMFPTVVRALGISVAYFCGRVGAILGYRLFTTTFDNHPS